MTNTVVHEEVVMAVTVSEIMNREVFSLRAVEAAADVAHYLVEHGITAAPVLDDDDRPIGFVALRDLVPASPGTRVGDVMSTPVDVIVASATIQDAAAVMARRSRHHLVCVDVVGRAVGFVSLLDVVRGLIGAPPSHPESFPHYESSTGLRWTDPIHFGFGTIELAPSGPGRFELVEGAPSCPNRVLLSETVEDVRGRLRELSVRKGAGSAQLRDAALGGHLWFRAASFRRG